MSISYSKLFVGISLPALCTGLASLLFCSSANAQDDFGIQSTTPLRPTIQKELRLYDQSSTSSVAGNIGIRAGAGTLSYTLTLPTLRPTANQVLAANAVSGGNVTLTWATPFSGTGTTNFLAKFASAGTLTNSLLFDNGTNVGIGTLTPASTLEVRSVFGNPPTSGTTTNAIFSITSSSAFPSLFFGLHSLESGVFYSPWIQAADRNNLENFRNLFLNPNGGNVAIGTGTITPTARLEIRGVGTTSATTALEVDNKIGNPLLVVKNDARVGIGTTSPKSALEILQGTSAFIRMVRSGSNADYGFEAGNNGMGLYDYTNSDYRWWVSPTGNVGIGTTNPLQRLTVSDTSIGETDLSSFEGRTAKTWNGTTILESIRLNSTFSGENSSWNLGRLSWGFAGNYSNNGARFGIDMINSLGNGFNNVLLITGGGNVGIGTLTPTAKLHVVSSSNSDNSEPNELSLERYSTSPNYSSSHLVQRSARGTATSPLTLQSGDVVAKSSAWSSTGAVNGFTEVGKFEWVATGNHSNSGNQYGSRLDIYTRQSGATSVTLRMTISDAGLDVNSNTMRLRTARTPTTALAAGNAGDICWDSSYLYICVATNTWRRIAHSTW